MGKKKKYVNHSVMHNNLFHNPNDKLNEKYEKKVQELNSSELLESVCNCLQLIGDKRELLSDAISKAFTAYYVGLQYLEESAPLRVQQKALKTVCNTAAKLMEALDELENIPEANQKFFEQISNIGEDDSESLFINHLLFTASQEKETPGHIYRDIISDISFAADEAAFDWEKFYKDFGDELPNDDFEDEMECEDDLEVLKSVFGKTKWTPIRRALLVLKNFWNEHVDETFTAGRHYKELGGYNSRTIEALELILTQVDPELSQRNIVTHMLAINP
ncbi:MAG: hypothetical protein ACRBDI_07265 [Alphaproteobacteria bacterium]